MNTRYHLGLYILGISISLTTFGYWGSSYDLPGMQVASLGSAGEVSIGSLFEIGRFRLTNPSRKKIMLRSIALRNYGTARIDESLLSASLWVHGNQISSRSWIERKDIYFSTPDYIIGGGDSVIIDVKSTVHYAHDRDTIQLGIRRAEDIIAIETGSGFAVGLSIDEISEMKPFSLSPGTISIQRTPPYRNSYPQRNYSSYYQSTRYPPASYYSNYSSRSSYRSIQRPTSSRIIGNQTRSPGSKGVSFLDFYVSQKTPVRADGAFFELSSTSIASDKNGNGIGNEIEDFNETFDDFRLYINGQEEDSANYLTSYRGKIGVLFDSSFDLLNGNNHFQVTGRIRNNAVSGDKIKLKGGSNFLLNPEYMYSGDAIPSSNINGSPTGNQTDVSGSSWFLYQ